MTEVFAPQDVFILSGTLVRDLHKCDCASLGMEVSGHESSCGLDFIGWIDEDVLPTNLWDFSQV